MRMFYQTPAAKVVAHDPSCPLQHITSPDDAGAFRCVAGCVASAPATATPVPAPGPAVLKPHRRVRKLKRPASPDVDDVAVDDGTSSTDDDDSHSYPFATPARAAVLPPAGGVDRRVDDGGDGSSTTDEDDVGVICNADALNMAWCDRSSSSSDLPLTGDDSDDFDGVAGLGGGDMSDTAAQIREAQDDPESKLAESRLDHYMPDGGFVTVSESISPVPSSTQESEDLARSEALSFGGSDCGRTRSGSAQAVTAAVAGATKAGAAIEDGHRASAQGSDGDEVGSLAAKLTAAWPSPAVKRSRLTGGPSRMKLLKGPPSASPVHRVAATLCGAADVSTVPMGAEATDDDMSWDDDDDVVVVVVDDDVDGVVGSLSSEGDSSQSFFECEFPASDDESLAPGVFVVCFPVADDTCEEFEAHTGMEFDAAAEAAAVAAEAGGNEDNHELLLKSRRPWWSD